MNVSLKRYDFSIDRLLARVKEGKHTMEKADEYIDLILSEKQYKEQRESTEEWKKDNLEYDLRSTEWICNKAKASDAYAQNLYAALCNNDFRKNDVWPLLQEKTWTCSWRYAGGIIADMRESGDYIDWYCSGIQYSDGVKNPNDGEGWSVEQIKRYEITKNYVSESVVTDEIRKDLLQLGWIVVDTDKY